MRVTVVGALALLAVSAVHSANLSPERWQADERAKLEQQERDSWSPSQPQLIEGSKGIVSATVSPIAVFAGVETLRQGGSAADAAATTALTQITTQLDSVVSYAGIFTMVYYDAKSHKVYSLDGGYNSYLNETDPSTIPVGDLGPLAGALKPTVGGANAPVLNAQVVSFLKDRNIDVSPANQLTKSYAAHVAPFLDELFSAPADATPHHSNAIVVVDKDGNIAAITHTINAVIWGDTGIVVDGVPIPDSAAFQQARLAALMPGDRVPHEIIDTITFLNDQPVLATASIGASLVPESHRVLLGVLGQHQDLPTVMAAPPLLAHLDFGNVDEALASRSVSLVQGAYTDGFLAELKEQQVRFVEVPAATAAGLRGTLAAVALDPRSGRRAAANQPGVMVFNAVQ